MLCQRPFVRDKTGKVFAGRIGEDGIDGVPFPCGQCLACRINRRRVWTLRNFLERQVHQDALFVTLTYNDENLPPDGVLVKRDLQLFLKRLRKAVHPVKVRYYACGEYGSQTHRPHYHLILYGIGDAYKDVVSRCWRYGFIHFGSATLDSIQYVAGYVAKKGTSYSVNGVREFACMSRKPGIGATALPHLERLLSDRTFRQKVMELGDVPNRLRIGKKVYPLGRYLITKLRELFDIPAERWQAKFQEYVEDLRVECLGVIYRDRHNPVAWYHHIVNKWSDARQNMIARYSRQNAFTRLTL